jgi:hypothetical protein
MSAFGGKADMTLCGNPLSRSLSGVKRTCFIAAQRSAFDPKHVRDRKIGEVDWRAPVEHAPPQSGDLKQGN